MRTDERKVAEKDGTGPAADRPVQTAVPKPRWREQPDAGAPEDLYVPSDIEIKSELWQIACGNGSEASRVSALRALADIMGLLRGSPPVFPEGMAQILDALSRGLDGQK